MISSVFEFKEKTSESSFFYLNFREKFIKCISAYLFKSQDILYKKFNNIIIALIKR